MRKTFARYIRWLLWFIPVWVILSLVATEDILSTLRWFMWAGLYVIGVLVVFALVGVFLWDDRKAERR